jgi:RepB DNA-primase from phage plasmid
MNLADLVRILPTMLDGAPDKQRNIIVRPHGPAVTFIQLDDLKALGLDRIAPAVFLILETSPENFQAWLRVAERNRRGAEPAGCDTAARRGHPRKSTTQDFAASSRPEQAAL